MSQPLSGVKVLDLTRLLPGNYCAWLLATLGAEVIKIEDPGAGDYMRTIGVQVDGQSAPHHSVNRAKRSIVLDLKSEEGREAFLRLVDSADVVVESFRSGVMDRLGVGAEVLRARRPSLVVASISGYGADGPLAGMAAHDLNALAFAGFQERLVGPDGTSPALLIPLSDQVGGGLVPALGIVALLMQARTTGRGGWLDSSLAEGFALLPSPMTSNVLAGAPLPPREETEFEGRAFYRVYDLIDGQVAVGAVEPQFWRGFCELMGEEDMVDLQWDDAHRDELVERLTRRFSALTKAEVEVMLKGHDVCVNLVQTYEEMFASDHAVARDLVRPAADVDMKVLAPPFRIDGQRPPETVGAPRQGQHTREVLAENGFADAEIDALLSSGAAVQGADT